MSEYFHHIQLRYNNRRHAVLLGNPIQLWTSSRCSQSSSNSTLQVFFGSRTPGSGFEAPRFAELGKTRSLREDDSLRQLSRFAIGWNAEKADPCTTDVA